MLWKIGRSEEGVIKVTKEDHCFSRKESKGRTRLNSTTEVGGEFFGLLFDSHFSAGGRDWMEPKKPLSSGPKGLILRDNKKIRFI